MSKIQNKSANNDNIVINIKHLINAILELTALLEHEVFLISDNKSNQIESLQAKKLDLIGFIENQKNVLSQTPTFFQNLDKSEQDYLKNLARKLHDTTSLNNNVLSKEVYFKQELMKTISDLVMEKAVNASRYTKDGKIDLKGIKKDPPSLSINDKI